MSEIYGYVRVSTTEHGRIYASVRNRELLRQKK